MYHHDHHHDPNIDVEKCKILGARTRKEKTISQHRITYARYTIKYSAKNKLKKKRS